MIVCWILEKKFANNPNPYQINIGGFAIPIRGASSRGITESQEHPPPLQASYRRSKLRGIQKENKLYHAAYKKKTSVTLPRVLLC